MRTRTPPSSGNGLEAERGARASRREWWFGGRRIPLAGALLTGALRAGAESAAPCTPPTAPTARVGDAIRLEHDAEVPRAVVDRAMALWQTCPAYGKDFPAFEVGENRDLRAIHVQLGGTSSVDFQCGTFRGHTITLHDEARDENGRPLTCGTLAQNLAHELGHVLGLGDLEDSRRCRMHIMSTITRTSINGRLVRPEECMAAGRRWLTTPEIERARALGYFDELGFRRLPLHLVDAVVNGRR
jgi:hypothetical protein